MSDPKDKNQEVVEQKKPTEVQNPEIEDKDLDKAAGGVNFG